MEQRIKGQEVSLIIASGNTILSTITDFRSFEVEFNIETLQEGYLGETVDRYDEIFRGTRGTTELHYENQDILRLIQSVMDRAARRQPGLVINFRTSLRFPNGQTPKVVIPNVFFGAIPLGFASRSDYGTAKLDFRAGTPRILIS